MARSLAASSGQRQRRASVRVTKRQKRHCGWSAALCGLMEGSCQSSPMSSRSSRLPAAKYMARSRPNSSALSCRASSTTHHVVLGEQRHCFRQRAVEEKRPGARVHRQPRVSLPHATSQLPGRQGAQDAEPLLLGPADQVVRNKGLAGPRLAQTHQGAAVTFKLRRQFFSRRRPNRRCARRLREALGSPKGFRDEEAALQGAP